MKKIKEIYFLETHDEKQGYYSDGFLFVAEDGTRIYSQSTDLVAHHLVSQPEGHDITHRIHEGRCLDCPQDKTVGLG